MNFVRRGISFIYIYYLVVVAMHFVGIICSNFDIFKFVSDHMKYSIGYSPLMIAITMFGIRERYLGKFSIEGQTVKKIKLGLTHIHWSMTTMKILMMVLLQNPD